MTVAAAQKLLTKLGTVTDPFAKRDLAERIKSTLMDQRAQLICPASSLPAATGAMCKALCPLLNAALQETDWRQPQHLAHLDACAVLMHAISRHLFVCEELHQMDMVAQLQASGILTALPAAMAKANAVLCTPNSPAPTDFTFTQYASFLLMLWSDMARKANPNIVCFYGNDPLVPLLGPGAAQLAVSVLAIYAGPRGASIMAANKLLSGFEGSMQVICASATNPTLSVLQQQMKQHGLGKTACCMAISNALLIADTFSLAAFNSYRVVNVEAPKILWKPPNTLQDKLLRDPWVAKLVTAMLFVQVKRLHHQQGGKAGAAAPRTRTSGRIKQSGAASDTSEAEAAEVPPYHNEIAMALGLDLLMTDEEVFNYVTGYDKTLADHFKEKLYAQLRNLLGAAAPVPPPPAADALPKPDVKLHDVDSSLLDPLLGLVTIFLMFQERLDMDTIVRHVSCGETLAEAMTSITRVRHLDDRVLAALLLTTTEVCLLRPPGSAPKSHIILENGEHALRLCYVVLHELRDTACQAGSESFIKAAASGPQGWVESAPTLLNPGLCAVLELVLRDYVALLVPLLLPECHNIALPSEAATDNTSKLSLLLPQQILGLAARVSEEFLAEVHHTRAGGSPQGG